MKQKESIVKDVESALSQAENLHDQLEILCQVVIRLGVSGMTHSSLPENITPENVVEIVINDMNDQGETIWNSLARQGLLMLTWLSK